MNRNAVQSFKNRIPFFGFENGAIVHLFKVLGSCKLIFIGGLLLTRRRGSDWTLDDNLQAREPGKAVRIGHGPATVIGPFRP